MVQLMCTLRTLGVTGLGALQRRRDDRGQTAAEYLGIVVVVAAIITGLLTTQIGQAIGAAILAQITAISGLGG